MPLYEFKCVQCGKTYEQIVHFDVTEVQCECGGKAPRQISAHGGYSIGGNNGASTKPSQAGSFKKG
jgi:putative FmdB family regulatory protein